MADGNNTPHTTAQITAFANYAKAIASHFAGRVDHFEIWNEWNGGMGNPERYGPDVYASLLKASYTAIKSVNPNAKVISCVTSTVDGGFINGVLNAGSYNYMDSVSVHPYTDPSSAEVGNPGWYSIASAANTINNIFVPYGAAKSIWMTEIGWSTTFVDQNHQAAYTARMFASGMASGISRMFSYDLQDDGTTTTDKELNWGLIQNWANVEVPWAAKQAYVSYNNATSLLKGATYASSSDTDRIRMIKFTRASDNKDIVMMFNLDDSNAPISVKGATANMQAYDMFGNVQSMPASLSYAPIYLIGTQGSFNANDVVTSSSVLMGDLNIESIANGLNSGRLNSFKYTLTESAILQSLSIHVKTASGSMRMGIYADNAGVPGALKASTAEFTPVVGWNTRNVTTPVLLPAGTYWLAFQPSSNSLQTSYTGSSDTLRYADRAYSALPGTFPASTSATGSTSLYATFYTQHLINNAVYTIEPLSAPGKTLDVNNAGGFSNGSNVQIWTSFVNWESASDNQKWKAVYAGNGYWKFMPLSAPSFSLDVNGGGTADGTNVQIWTDDAADAKQWKITSADVGYYQLEPKVAPGKALDVTSNGTTDGTNVQIWTANGGANQKWKFNLYSNAPSQALMNNAIYTIEPLSAPGKVLDANGGVNGSNVQIWSSLSGNNQKWKAVDGGGGFWKLFPISAPAYSLDVDGGSNADGTNIQIWTDDAVNARLFMPRDLVNGYYEIEPKVAPGKRLDVAGMGTADGTNVQIWSFNASSNQKWRFNLVSSYTP